MPHALKRKKILKRDNLKKDLDAYRVDEACCVSDSMDFPLRLFL